MKEFNWEGFRNGEFVVSCDTEEKAKDFVKEAYEKGVRWMFPDKNKTNWCFYKENTCYYGQSGLTFGDIDNCNETIIEWRNNDMKNFREVIRDIKEGEIWENEKCEIFIDKENDGVSIKKKEGHFYCEEICISNKNKFKLKQQPVTFEEVLNSDKMCKVEHELIDKNEIYSKMDGFTRDGYTLITNLFKSMSDHLYTEEFREVIKNGKWYLEP